MLQPRIVGEEHYETAQRVKQTLQRYKELQDIIAKATRSCVHQRGTIPNMARKHGIGKEAHR